MKNLRIYNTTRQSVLGTRIGVAETWWTRLRGFLGRPEPQPGAGLMLVPCRGVHMHGMKYALDVIFLDHAGEVIRTYPELRPGSRTPYHRSAEYVIELPVGTIAATGTQPGDRVVWFPANTPDQPLPWREPDLKKAGDRFPGGDYTVANGSYRG